MSGAEGRPEKAGGRGEVSVMALQEAFLRSNVEPWTVAMRMGWFTNSHGWTSWDGSRVKRVLGLRPAGDTTVPGAYRTRVEYDTAVRLAEAIGVDPWEVGL